MKEMVGGCCVCSDERGWPENPLVYCDGQNCTVAVHQACYGIVTVPTGPWFCRKCESQERPARVRCELCPSRDGALKRTDNQGWAHVVCALYIPEVRFGNVTTMEPIILQLIPSERYAKSCYICQEIGKPSRANVGACMQCNKFNCKQQFHVTCAQSLGLLCEEAGNYLDNVKYCGYCQHHYSKLKKGGNVKTIPPYKPITHDSSGSDSGSSPEKEIDSTISVTASSTSATCIKITNAVGSSSVNSSGSIGLSSSKQRKSSIASKISNSSCSGTTASAASNSSGTNTTVTGNSGSGSLVGQTNINENTANSGGSNNNANLNLNTKSNISSVSSKEKEKHNKNLSKINLSKEKEKDKDLSSSSSSSTSREKGSKYKIKETAEHGSVGIGVSNVVTGAGALSGSAQNVTNLCTRSGLGLDTSLNTSDNNFPITDTISNPQSTTISTKNSGTSLAKKRKADSKAGLIGDTSDINHTFRDIIKDVSVTLTPLPLDKTSDIGEVSKKQRTELSPPTHQSTEQSIPNVSPKHLPSTKSQSHTFGSSSQAQNTLPTESSITSSTAPSSSSHKSSKDRDERLSSTSPFTSTVSSAAGINLSSGVTTGGNAAPSLYVSVPLSTANVPGLNLPTTTTADHSNPSQSTRTAAQQQSSVIERQSPRIHQQVPPISEHGSFSSLSLPTNVVAGVQSGKSSSPNITSGNLTASTTESGSLKISYEKQSSRVVQLQEQESAPVRRSRSRSGEHNNFIPVKPRFGKKRSTTNSSVQLTKSSSSSSLAVASSEHPDQLQAQTQQQQQQQQQQQYQQKSNSSVSLTSHALDLFTENSQKSQPTSPAPTSSAPQPLPLSSTFTTKTVNNDKSELNSPPNNSGVNNNKNSNTSSSSNNNNGGTINNSKTNNNNNDSCDSAMNLASSPSTSSATPSAVASASTTSSQPSCSSLSALNFTSITHSSSVQTNVASVKNNSSKISNSEIENNTTSLISNSYTTNCSPVTPSPPAPSISTNIIATPSVGSNVSTSKTLNKKLLRAQQTLLQQQQQQQQLMAFQQEQQQQPQSTALTKTMDDTSQNAHISSLPIDDSNSNPILPQTISRTPDSGVLSSSCNVSGSSQNLHSATSSATTSSANGSLKFTYETQLGALSNTLTSNTDTNLANNTGFKDSPPSSPGSEAGSSRKRGRKSNELKDIKVFQNGCAVSTPITNPSLATNSNGPIHATHMLGNQLNPTSSVAQKLTDQLHMEMQDHSVYTESQPPQFVGVPFPSRPSNNLRNPASIPSSASSLASMFGTNGGGYAPQSLEQLLERQWEQGSQFLMEQAQHFDIASLLSCLHQLQTENVRLEEHVNNLIARRDHLLAVNARLAIPLNANVPQSQVNPNNIHQNGPKQTEIIPTSPVSSAVVPSLVSTATSAVSNPLPSNSRVQRSSATSTQAPITENGNDFRHSAAAQPVSVAGTLASPITTQASIQSSGGISLRHSSMHPNFSTTNTSSFASHHSGPQHHQLHHQQQQMTSLTQQSTLSSSASSVNCVMSSSSRPTHQLAQPPPHHHLPSQPHHSQHLQSHHPQHHSHLVQQPQQQQHQHQQSPHSSHHHYNQAQSHLLTQHSQNQHHSSSTGSAAPHHLHQKTSTPQTSISAGDTSNRMTGGVSNVAPGRTNIGGDSGEVGDEGGSGGGGGGVGGGAIVIGGSSGSGVVASQILTGRSSHADNSGFHPVYSHQSQLRRDDTQVKNS